MSLFSIFTDNKQRFLTGIILIAVVAAIGLINNFFVIWLFFGIVYMFSFYEAMRLFKIENNQMYAYAAGLWLLALIYPNPDDLFFLIAVVFASLLAYTREFDKKLFLPFLYPTASFLFLLTLYNDFGIDSLIWLVVVVALTDIGAFFVGKMAGKRQFCVTSPNKTIEGVAGGVVIATFAGFFTGSMLVDWPQALLISFGVSVASIFGDLFESYLKREAGVKDSGNILPGHGGMLDRVDGYLFSGIVMVLLLRGLL
ncbi:phosphatidate cytidylyltransferase [Hydrogenimonas thermophila]|uniref:Phosphatidate cytidylyltransferase n=1 Tax=Hydrogenimonas thermophila TaxID=223786 RepID=A0A1I5NGE4_9BACT|nr:phosphatidate cytidylyltransferase [Hydrogenimonas thermophila]WOE69844.1 phosphatidate cytidylyltransferase [Hydrogenimonas thermophila]WOE72359.1 phosphatidate cytidylyltransferase [Hydrogenimonas thermophila]SFP20844.1 phosphatidate cytidylyltransferase [Hydrogenimonas thermophila]